jgi:hypothetical protein
MEACRRPKCASAPRGRRALARSDRRQTALGRNKQSPHPARRRSSHFSATPISATVAVANIGGNGVPYAPQVSHAVSDQPGAYSATPEKKPKNGHCIAHANWLCRQPGVGSMRIPREVVDGLRRFGYAPAQQVDLAGQRHDQTVDPVAPEDRVEFGALYGQLADRAVEVDVGDLPRALVLAH